MDDPKLVVGILGGSAGTTYDAFKLIYDAQKYGARGPLFGRKINNAEHQLAFIEMLRLITDGKISPEEAVRAYHGVLQGKNIRPKLPLEKDLELTDQTMSYDGNAARRATKAQCGSGDRCLEARGNPQLDVESLAARPRPPWPSGRRTAPTPTTRPTCRRRHERRLPLSCWCAGGSCPR